MASREPDRNARLEEPLKRWERDHLKGEVQVVIKQRQTSGPIPLNEFSNTRLTILHAVEELEAALFFPLRTRLGSMAVEVRQLGMPPLEACDEYAARAGRTAKECVDQFKGAIAALLSSKEGLWDECERRFSQDEIEGFNKRFGSVVDGLVAETGSAFKSIAWATPQPVPAVSGDTHSNTAGTKSEPPEQASERAALLHAYKGECAAHGIRVTDQMIAAAARPTWHDRTPVQRWKRNDRRCTPGDDSAIRTVLRKKPHLSDSHKLVK